MGLQQPVFLDSTVLSNFASTDSVDWLIDLLEDPVVTPEVARELREGIAAGYDFLQPAVDAVGDGIRLHETPGTMIDEWADQLGERLDPGEAESAAYAAVEQGTLATDDLAARELAGESSARLTGSIGLLVLGINQGVLDIETANQWLGTWRRERGYYAPVQRVEEVLNEE
jgi:predicted nucleic acid-binding protein